MLKVIPTEDFSSFTGLWYRFLCMSYAKPWVLSIRGLYETQPQRLDHLDGREFFIFLNV